MQEKIIKTIEKEKIIVIVRGVAKEKMLPLAKAMYDGGIRLMECTYDARGVMPDEENAQNIATLVNYFGDKMRIGAGTVLTEKQVELTKKAGGQFVISPDTNTAVICKTKELGMVSIPGALTPTEIVTAYNAGADFVKIFPVDSLGVHYVKAVKAPLSHIKLLAVGGVNEKNIQSFLDAGACGIGIGCGVVNKERIENNDFEQITALARKYTEQL